MKHKFKHQNHIDFVGIGAQKAGTTWLYSNLNKIPAFDLLPKKEIHYFDRDKSYPSPNFLHQTNFWQRITNYKYGSKAIVTLLKSILTGNFKNVLFYTKWYFQNYNDRWYLSLFKNTEGYTGEITPSYSILNESDIISMHKLLPDVKLILMLRNPIERAWSQYLFNHRNEKDFDVNGLSYEEVIKFMDSEAQELRSNYIRTLENYLKVFQKEQILVCFFDAISSEPKLLMKEVIKHITGKTSISIKHLNLNQVVNKSRPIECPKEIKEYLKEKYYDQIKALSDRYGGYFTTWFEESYREASNINLRTPSPTLYL